MDTAFDRSAQAMEERRRRELKDKLRDGCFNIEWFRSRTEARVLIEIWRRDYNDVRPHSSLDYRTPHGFCRHHESSLQRVFACGGQVDR